MKTITTILACLFIFGMDASNNQLKLRMCGNGHYDEIVLGFDPAGSTTFNPELDAWKLFSSVHTVGQLYTQCAPSEPLSVYAMPLSALDTTIDLYTLIGQSGTYTLAGTELSPFAAGQGIFLEDKTTGQQFDLRNGQVVTVVLPVIALNSPSAFRVHFKKPAVLPLSVSTFVSDSVCSGSSYIFPDGTLLDNIVSTSIYTSHFTAADGSDSAIVTTVSAMPVYNIAVSATVCSGDSYTFPDGTYMDAISASLTQVSHLHTSTGCDSLIVTGVTVNPSYYISDSVVVCNGSRYTFPDHFSRIVYSAQSPVVHTSKYKTVAGCDSLLITTLIVPAVNTQAVSVVVCPGSSYSFPDGTVQDTIYSTLIQTSHFTSAAGCDSSIVTTVNPGSLTADSVFASVCSGSSYSLPDGTVLNAITSNSSYTSHLLSSGGCDSLVVTSLTVNPVYHLQETVSVCRGSNYIFPDGFSMVCRTPQKTADGDVQAAIEENRMRGNFHTSYLKTVLGCDSIINITLIPLPASVNAPVSDSVCSGSGYTFPDGTTQYSIYAATTHTSYFQNINGCDSSIVTNLSIRTPYQIAVSVIVCSGSSYTFPDGSTQDTISVPVVQTSHFTSTQGCDSAIVTSLTVNPVYSQASYASVCSGSSFTFPDGSVLDSITSTVFHTSKFQSISGCDSLVISTVSVNPVSVQSVSVSVCSGSGYTFPDGSVQSGITSALVQTSHFQSVAGCDSSIVTQIFVHPVSNQSVSVSVCSGSSVLFPDGASQDTVTVAFLHTSYLQSTSGCDSIIVTSVSVIQPSTLNVSAFVCMGASYTFPDGSTEDNITTTMQHSSILHNQSGCDSVIVTLLSVNSLPVVTISSNNTTLCAGSNLSLNGHGALAYAWSDGVTNGVAFIPAASQRYYLTGTDVNSCTDTASIAIVVNSLPVISYLFDFADTVCQYAGNQHLCYASPVGGIYSGAGVSGVTFNPLVAGVGRHMITYSYTDANACSTAVSDTVLVVPAILTGIAPLAGVSKLSIYPNPSSGSITVISSGILNVISIYSAAGELVYSSKSVSAEQTIDLSMLSAGAYVLEVQGKHYRIIRD